MFLYLYVDGDTMKKVWDYEKCKDCLQRFECYTDDRISVKPDKLDLSEDEYIYNYHRNRYKAEFHLPLCIRIGLFKQIGDTGYWSQSYNHDYGDGFKLGAVFGDEGEQITVDRSWIKLPNVLYVTGGLRSVGVNG